MSPEFCRNIDEQCLSNASLLFIGIGACMTLPSLMWPIDLYYHINPNLSAQENEEREEAHSRMMYALSTIAFVGMAFIGVGAIITSVLIFKILVVDVCSRDEAKQKQGGNNGDLQKQPQDKQVIGAEDSSRHKTVQNVGNASIVSSIQQGTLRQEQRQGKSRDDKDILVASDHLEMNRVFSSAKPYGSMGQ